jgi:hypothetical protein
MNASEKVRDGFDLSYRGSAHGHARLLAWFEPPTGSPPGGSAIVRGDGRVEAREQIGVHLGRPSIPLRSGMKREKACWRVREA